MLHLSTETYRNEQASKVFFSRISAETCLKTDYLGRKSPQIAKSWGLYPQTPVQMRWLENV